MDQKVVVEPQHIFGVRREAKNNLLFLDEQTMVFPSGNNCVLYNVHQQRIKFIPGAVTYRQRKQGVQALAISPDRRYLAVSECGDQGTVSVFDLQSEQCFKREVLTGVDVQKFVCMSFSADSKYLLCQSGGPEWVLYYWEWQKDEVIAWVKTTRLGFVSQVSFNPMDNTQICVSGNYVFKIFQLENDSLVQTTMFEMDLENIESHAWLSEDSIVIGTQIGKLLLLKNGQWHRLRRPFESQRVKCDPSAPLAGITAITAYSKGFACAGRLGVVCLYERTGEYGYRKTAEIRIPEDPCNNDPSQSAQQEVKAMCLSPSEETLAISTRQGQIYHVSLASVEISQAKFEYLFHSLHSGSITALAVCSSRPIFATCSKDNSVRIWNYKTKSLELYKEFPEEPNCISLHPNGLSILVGFSDKVCLMNLLIDEFRTVQEFDVPDCSKCVFNHDGNLFAAVSDDLISIVNVRTGEKMNLNGHTDMVQSLKWSEDDRHLVSSGTDCAICKWNTLTGDCEVANVQKSYTDLIFTVASDFALNESRDREILREMVSDDVACTAVSVTNSGRAVFVGTAAGTVRVMQYALEEERSYTEHPAHSGPISKMVVTPDDQYLVTASEDGSLLIWAITDQDGHQLGMVKETCFTEEVLCTKAFLKQKDQSILEAHTQIELVKKEQECELNDTRLAYKEKLDNVRRMFHKRIEDLESLTEKLNTEKEEQQIFYEKTLSEMKERHAAELDKMENMHVHEMFQAFQDQEALEQKLEKLKKDYWEKVREEEDSYFHIKNMKQRLQEQQCQLQQFQDKLKELQEKIDFEFKESLIQQDEELQEELETSKKLEDEMESMEKKMVQFWKIEGEIEQQCLGNSQLEDKVEEINIKKQKIIENLQQRLQTQEAELCTEKTKVKSLKTMLTRIKADILDCSTFSRQPTLLRNSFKKLQKMYIHEADVTLGRTAGNAQDHTKESERLQSSQPLEPSSPQTPRLKIQKNVRNNEAFSEICLKYKQELQVEKETCSQLKNKIKLMEQQWQKIKEEMQVQNLEISMLQDEVQSLHDKHKGGKKLKNLRKEKKQNKTVQEQEIHFQDIAEMHEKNLIQTEAVLISITSQLDELIKNPNRPTGQTDKTELELVNRFKEKMQFFKKLEAKVEEMNSRNQEALHKLKQKLKVKDNELCTERQRVRNIRILMNRMKADIQTCSDFIQQPKLLKENFLKLYRCYIKKDARVQVQQQSASEEQQETMVPLMNSPHFEPRPPPYPRLLKRRAMAEEFLSQSMDEEHQDRTQDTQTTIIDAHFRTVMPKDSQMKPEGSPMILPPMLCSRSQRLKLAIKLMKQSQAEQQSSSEAVKFPPIRTHDRRGGIEHLDRPCAY